MITFPETSQIRAGVMGWPVGHSLSPRLHGFWLRKYGINGRYDKIPVEHGNLRTALRNLPTQGLQGVNLTVPHKESACEIVDTLDNTARRIGAVNLVTVDADGTLHGRNTDAFGFAQNLITSGFKPTNGTAVLLGAGGAARAVIVALQDIGFTSISIANRTVERAEHIAAAFSTPLHTVTAIAWPDARVAMHNAELLVNTTALGMTGQPPLGITLDSLPLSAAVTDVVYSPLETDLLRTARLRGHNCIDGLGMLLHQARPAFAAFFGTDPEVTPELRQFLASEAA
jgi:shikimate dehydrogenase